MAKNDEGPILGSWHDPPAAFRPVQIIHNYTPSTEEDIKKFIQRAKTLGLGGFVVNVDVGHGKDDQYERYLVDQAEWERLRLFVSLAIAHGFTIWLYDERGYPSGSAGKWVIDGNPEYQVQGVICQQVDISGSQKRGEIELDQGSVLSAAALPRTANGQLGGERIDLQANIAGRTLSYALPQGEWTIVVLIAKPLAWMCKAGTPYVDLLNPAVTKKFIQVTHERYLAELGPEIMGNIEAIFTDEPGVAVHGCASVFKETHPVIPWTTDFEAIFATEYGYNLLPKMEKIFLPLNDPEAKQVRRDYWRLVTRT